MAVARWAGIALVLAGTACIIPETNIEVIPDRANPGAVRLVQRVAMTDAANDACAQVKRIYSEECPLPPPSQPAGLVDLVDEGQAFCSCGNNERDGNALRQFDVFVEDPDRDDSGPTDDILGVFLLDAVPGEDPSEFLAYENYLPPNEPATLFPIGRGSYNDAILRPSPNLKSWTIGIEGRFDLCNDNAGQRLFPGLHQLQLVVTDRPWYVEVQTDEKGDPKRVDGELQRLDEDPRVGVPDLPAGASYDTAVFVFRCLDASDPACGCEAEEDM